MALWAQISPPPQQKKNERLVRLHLPSRLTKDHVWSHPSSQPERHKTCLCSLMLTVLMQILRIEWVVYCLVKILRHLCSVVGVFALCVCSCVNTHEIPDRLEFDSIKAMMNVGGFLGRARHVASYTRHLTRGKVRRRDSWAVNTSHCNRVMQFSFCKWV